MVKIKVYDRGGGTSFHILLPPNYVREHNITKNEEVDMRENEFKQIILTPKDVENELSEITKMKAVQEFLVKSKLKIQEDKDDSTD